MTPRTSEILDLYSDYLIASFGQTTATCMAKLVSHLSHDQITRFLGGEPFGDKDLWKIVKAPLRQMEFADGVSLPVSLHLVLKTKLGVDPKTGRDKW